MKLGKVLASRTFRAALRKWNWKETKLHLPGIQLVNVMELLEHGSGMELVLQTCPETIALSEEKGIEFYIEETHAAVELYNRLAETRPVVSSCTRLVKAFA